MTAVVVAEEVSVVEFAVATSVPPAVADVEVAVVSSSVPAVRAIVVVAALGTFAAAHDKSSVAPLAFVFACEVVVLETVVAVDIAADFEIVVVVVDYYIVKHES